MWSVTTVASLKLTSITRGTPVKIYRTSSDGVRIHIREVTESKTALGFRLMRKCEFSVTHWKLHYCVCQSAVLPAVEQMSWPDWDLSPLITLVGYMLQGVAMVTSGWLNVSHQDDVWCGSSVVTCCCLRRWTMLARSSAVFRMKITSCVFFKRAWNLKEENSALFNCLNTFGTVDFQQTLWDISYTVILNISANSNLCCEQSYYHKLFYLFAVSICASFNYKKNNNL